MNSGILQSVTAMDTAMTEDMGFLGMMQSLDAFFPVGAFTLSNGLEDYVLRDRIQNGKDLENYIQGFFRFFLTVILELSPSLTEMPAAGRPFWNWMLSGP